MRPAQALFRCCFPAGYRGESSVGLGSSHRRHLLDAFSGVSDRHEFHQETELLAINNCVLTVRGRSNLYSSRADALDWIQIQFRSHGFVIVDFFHSRY